jgi:hypothetical protein
LLKVTTDLLRDPSALVSQRVQVRSHFVNTFSKCLAAIAMLSGSALASAGTETLDYQGNLMTGTQTTWNGESAVTNADTGTYTAIMNVSNDGSDGWSVGSWSIDLNGAQALSGNGNGVNPGGVPVAGINLQELNGNVVGAAISWSFTSTGPFASTETINVGGSGGDSFLDQSGCSRNAPGGGGLCPTSLSNSTQGTWTVAGAAAAAPEIDPASAASALTLLVGFAAIMRGRKRTAQ